MRGWGSLGGWENWKHRGYFEDSVMMLFECALIWMMMFYCTQRHTHSAKTTLLPLLILSCLVCTLHCYLPGGPIISPPHLSFSAYWAVAASHLVHQKRHVSVSNENYFSVKRDLPRSGGFPLGPFHLHAVKDFS
jgi:hypothetical protein